MAYLGSQSTDSTTISAHFPFKWGKKTNEVMQQNNFVNLLCNNNKNRNNTLFQFQLFIHLSVDLTA
jgi:hypothetical protein